jgi:serine/threonine protein kinase
VLDALEYLHTQTPPIIHRNIKPENIRLASPGRVMLVNLGIANPLVGGDATSRGYAPLEQYSSGTMDARADLYALGATLYFALTTQAPPDAVDRAMGVVLVSPRAQNPNITPRVEQAILYAMQMASTDRPQSAAEMRCTLTEDVPTRSVVSRPANAPMLGRWLRMGLATTVGAQLLAGLATLVLVLVAVLITVCFVLYALDVLMRAVQVP